jgi:hypothetical protein
MKTFLSVITVIVYICCSNLSRVNGQALATGHITAEIVNDIKAVSKTVTNFNLINKDAKAELSKSGQMSLNPSNLNLGLLTINSGKGVVCQMVITPAKLSDTKGNSFIIEPNITTNSSTYFSPNQNGETLQISGKAKLQNQQVPGLYQGTYTIIIVFN